MAEMAGDESPQANGIASEIQEKESDTPDDWAGMPSFELPLLNLKSSEERTEFVLLAWALLLYRGSIDDDVDSFSWGSSYPGDENSLRSSPAWVKVTEIIPGDTTRILKVLEEVGAVRRRLCHSPCFEDQVLLLKAAKSSSAHVCNSNHLFESRLTQARRKPPPFR